MEVILNLNKSLKARMWRVTHRVIAITGVCNTKIE